MHERDYARHGNGGDWAMKILVYVKLWNGFGGGEQSVRTIMAGLSALGHDYEVISSDGIVGTRFHAQRPDIIDQIKAIAPDVIFTQLNWSINLKPIAREIGIPIDHTARRT